MKQTKTERKFRELIKEKDLLEIRKQEINSEINKMRRKAYAKFKKQLKSINNQLVAVDENLRSL